MNETENLTKGIIKTIVIIIISFYLGHLLHPIGKLISIFSEWISIPEYHKYLTVLLLYTLLGLLVFLPLSIYSYIKSIKHKSDLSKTRNSFISLFAENNNLKEELQKVKMELKYKDKAKNGLI